MILINVFSSPLLLLNRNTLQYGFRTMLSIYSERRACNRSSKNFCFMFNLNIIYLLLMRHHFSLLDWGCLEYDISREPQKTEYKHCFLVINLVSYCSELLEQTSLEFLGTRYTIAIFTYRLQLPRYETRTPFNIDRDSIDLFQHSEPN